MNINLAEIIKECVLDMIDEDMIRGAIENALDYDDIQEKIAHQIGDFIELEIDSAIEDALSDIC